MIKPNRLRQGDKVAIVSLSSGMLGEAFCQHYIDLGQQRLRSFGLEPVFMENTLKGIDYLHQHPEKRAEDLKSAFLDKDIKGIICAIGGVDTYRTVPYLLDDPEFISAVEHHPKLLTGFSDTTVNHLMFYQLGLVTYYGPNYINDLSEMDRDLLPYTKKSIANYYMGEDLLADIQSSEIWYEERTDFSTTAMGTSRVTHHEDKGYELIQGAYPFEGELLGGCLESLAELLLGERNINAKIVSEQYGLFPDERTWAGKILFIETSEGKPDELAYRKYLQVLKSKGVFKQIAGVLHGKPQNEVHYELYKRVLIEEIDRPDLPIVFNVNFGHAYPRTVLGYGLKVLVDKGVIRYLEPCMA